MNVGVHGGQKRLFPLELELQAIVSPRTLILGNQLNALKEQYVLLTAKPHLEGHKELNFKE